MKAKEFFDVNFKSYIQFADWASNNELCAESLNMFNSINSKTAIELGSGNCKLLKQIQSSQKIAIDISARMLELCDDESISKIVADVHLIPLQNNCTDLVICRQLAHYCDLLVLLQEINRILAKNALLHIVQITDYEDVPESFYEYWIGLRGINGRKRLSRSKIVDLAESQGFYLSKEKQFDLPVAHSWSSFFKKNLVQVSKQAEVKKFFRELSPAIKERFEMINCENTIKYKRNISLLNFKLKK